VQLHTIHSTVTSAPTYSFSTPIRFGKSQTIAHIYRQLRNYERAHTERYPSAGSPERARESSAATRSDYIHVCSLLTQITSIENRFVDQVQPSTYLIDNADRVYKASDEDKEMDDFDGEEEAISEAELIKTSREHMVVINSTVIPIPQYLGDEYTNDIVSKKNIF
jgi:hypothetical protein